MKVNHPLRNVKAAGGGAVVMIGLGAALLAGDAFAAGSVPSHKQVTLGGATYFVRGEITKITDNKYWIETPAGAVKRVEVNENTHMICPSRGDQAERENPTGSGFRIGDCPFRTGDTVKAEISDIGTAMFIRELERAAPTRTERLGMPQRYTVLPIWPDALFQTEHVSGYTVKNLDGEKIGRLNKVVIEGTSGDPAYAIVELDNGSLMPVPYSALKVSAKKRTVKLQMSRENLVYAPTFEKEISVSEMRKFWEREFNGDWEPALGRPYEDQWVKDVVDELRSRSSLHETLVEHPGAPTHWISLLNRAAEQLNEGRSSAARNYFSHALHAVDEEIESGRFPKSEGERIMSAMVLHAPDRLAKMVSDTVMSAQADVEPSIDMAKAIAVAVDVWPGHVINADYLGEFGQNLYRIKVMAGTDVTRVIEVDGETGAIEKSMIMPGHSMPNESFP